jgi:hypothetical protein
VNKNRKRDKWALKVKEITLSEEQNINSQQPGQCSAEGKGGELRHFKGFNLKMQKILINWHKYAYPVCLYIKYVNWNLC